MLAVEYVIDPFAQGLFFRDFMTSLDCSTMQMILWSRVESEHIRQVSDSARLKHILHWVVLFLTSVIARGKCKGIIGARFQDVERKSLGGLWPYAGQLVELVY